jgi:hypothetical protein
MKVRNHRQIEPPGVTAKDITMCPLSAKPARLAARASVIEYCGDAI